MILLLALQIAILLLIALSFILLIAVPLAASSQKEWEENKALIFLCAGGCLVLLIIIGVLNSFVS